MLSPDDAASPPAAATSSSSKPRRKKNRMSAIRVWSDSGDQGLELLVVEHASEEQQLSCQPSRAHHSSLHSLAISTAHRRLC